MIIKTIQELINFISSPILGEITLFDIIVIISIIGGTIITIIDHRRKK